MVAGLQLCWFMASAQGVFKTSVRIPRLCMPTPSNNLTCSSLHWRNNIEAIAEAGYKVYAPDLLGLGASEKPVMDYEMVSGRPCLMGLCYPLHGMDFQTT